MLLTEISIQKQSRKQGKIHRLRPVVAIATPQLLWGDDIVVGHTGNRHAGAAVRASGSISLLKPTHPDKQLVVCG